MMGAGVGVLHWEGVGRIWEGVGRALAGGEDWVWESNL